MEESELTEDLHSTPAAKSLAPVLLHIDWQSGKPGFQE
jgi:hypothetical protein